MIISGTNTGKNQANKKNITGTFGSKSISIMCVRNKTMKTINTDDNKGKIRENIEKV